MAVKECYLRFSAIISMLFSIGFFILSVVYSFISNLPLLWIIALSIIALIEMIVFWFSLLLVINPKKRIFFIGLLSLFAGLVPGVMILGFYFKTKKALLRNFQLDA